jgi:hypothetical protein
VRINSFDFHKKDAGRNAGVFRFLTVAVGHLLLATEVMFRMSEFNPTAIDFFNSLLMRMELEECE